MKKLIKKSPKNFFFLFQVSQIAMRAHINYNLTLPLTTSQYIILPSCVQTFLNLCSSLAVCNFFILLNVRFSVILILDSLSFFFFLKLSSWCCNVQTLQLLALISRLAFFHTIYGFDQYL